MWSFTYTTNSEYNPVFIRETASIEQYERGRKPHLRDCSEEEITHIRLVLQKLTALRVINIEDAEDLVQDTFLTLTMKCPDIDLEKGLLVWSMGILRKKVGNYYRKARRAAVLNGSRELAQHCIDRTPSPGSPEVLLHQSELNALIKRVLQTLPASHRQALELLLSGLQASEIVEILSPGRYQNAINWIHRGRKTLGRELAKYGYGPAIKSTVEKP